MEKVIKFGDIDVSFKEGETNELLVQIDKVDIRTNDIRLLDLMNQAKAYFVSQEVSEEEDYYTFHYQLPTTMITWDEISKLAYHEQLRLLINVNRFYELLNNRLNVVLHPDNLVYDDNLIPHCIYRGLKEVVIPMNQDEAEYLKQYQCLIVASFTSKYGFSELYEGCLSLVKESNFIKSIVSVTTVTELLELLEEEYRTEKNKVTTTMMLLPKNRLTLYKRFTIALTIISILLVLPLGYMALNVVPYQSNLLDANSAFIANDYELVISKLRDQNVKGLPQSAKYQLAYSYVQGEALSKEQLTTIMGILSLKTDERYLLFWIYNGQGEYEKALDVAQSLGDEQLIIYAVYKNIELVNNDKKISGADKQKKLKELNDTLEAAKTKIIEENAEANTPK